MLRRAVFWLFARHVDADTDRLFRLHGCYALFVVRRAVLAAREGTSTGHWTRVLTQVEMRVGYRPW